AAPQHAAALPSGTPPRPAPDPGLGLSPQPGAASGGAAGRPAQAGQAGPAPPAAGAGSGQTEGAAQSPAGGHRTAAGVPRPAGDVGVPRNDLPVDLRARPRRAPPGAGGLPAQRARAAAAPRAESG